MTSSEVIRLRKQELAEARVDVESQEEKFDACDAQMFLNEEKNLEDHKRTVEAAVGRVEQQLAASQDTLEEREEQLSDLWYHVYDAEAGEKRASSQLAEKAKAHGILEDEQDHLKHQLRFANEGQAQLKQQLETARGDALHELTLKERERQGWSEHIKAQMDRAAEGFQEQLSQRERE